MALYGYGISVSGSRTPTVASSTPAPSGIPVASTASVIIGGGTDFDGTAVKKVNPEICIGNIEEGYTLYVYSGASYSYQLGYQSGKILIPPQTELSTHPIFLSLALNTPFGTWRLAQVTYEDDQFYIADQIANPSTNPNFIPTTGWNPAITITAV
jgi:hypothetical protein